MVLLVPLQINEIDMKWMLKHFEIRDPDVKNEPVIDIRSTLEEAQAYGESLGRNYFVRPVVETDDARANKIIRKNK